MKKDEKKEEKKLGKVDGVKIVKQESITLDGETKIKYTYSDGSETIKGL